MKRVLIILNLIFAFWGGFVLIYLKKLSFIPWIILDTTSAVQILVVVALIFGSRILMNFCIPFLLFYGTVGLFIAEWQLEMLPAHFNHALITLTIIYILFVTVKKLQLLKMAFGLLLGVLVFIGFKIFFQNRFIDAPKNYEMKKYYLEASWKYKFPIKFKKKI